MTRTLFFFTALAAMLFAVTAIVIRVELAHPDISSLFAVIHEDGTIEGDRFKFKLVLKLHALFGYLAAMLLGTTMLSAARQKKALGVTPMLILGALACGALVGSLLIMSINVSPALEARPGWVLYPPLSAQGTGAFPPGTNFLPADVFSFVTVFTSPLAPFSQNAMNGLIAVSAALLFSGAYAMLSTIKGFRAMALLGQLIALGTSLLFVGTMDGGQLHLMVMLFALPVLPLIGCAAIRLIDPNPPAWLIVLTLGALILLVAEYVVFLNGIYVFATRGAASSVVPYVFPLGLAWFALPALLLFTHDTRLPGWMVWAIPPILCVPFLMWVIPFFGVRSEGISEGSLAYPAEFGGDQIIMTSGTIIFIASYLAVITIVRRHRLRLS